MVRLRSTLTALVTVLALADGAIAQEPTEPPPKPRRSFISTEIALGLGRQSAEGDATSGFGDYAEQFADGVGAEFEIGLHLFTRQAPHASLALGPLVRVGRHRFAGHTALNAAGDALAVDALDVTRFEVGFHLTARFGEVSFGPQLALGIALLDAVDGRLTLAGGGGLEGPLYRETTTISFQFRLRLGWSVELAHGHRLGLEGYVGFGAFGPSHVVSDPGSVLPTNDPSTMDGAQFGLRITFEWRRAPSGS